MIGMRVKTQYGIFTQTADRGYTHLVLCLEEETARQERLRRVIERMMTSMIPYHPPKDEQRLGALWMEKMGPNPWVCLRWSRSLAAARRAKREFSRSAPGMPNVERVVVIEIATGREVA